MYKTILLADDDTDDVDLFQEALLEVDASILLHRAINGSQVLELLNDKSLQHPDLIFLDINMPGMNAWQCIDKLKANEALKHIPVIIYSTSSNNGDIGKAIQSGVVCFITKPNDYDGLKKLIELILVTPVNEMLKISDCHMQEASFMQNDLQPNAERKK